MEMQQHQGQLQTDGYTIFYFSVETLAHILGKRCVITKHACHSGVRTCSHWLSGFVGMGHKKESLCSDLPTSLTQLIRGLQPKITCQINNIYSIFSVSHSEQERWLISAIFCRKRAANGNTVFPCQSDLRLPASSSHISLPRLCFISEGFCDACTMGGSLRLAFCTALHSSALEATAAAWSLQLRNESPGQVVILVY